MNPDIKKLWLKALESGNYIQGKGCLNNGQFCCLGVLTDLYIKEIGAEWETDSSGFRSWDDENAILAKSVQQWAGLTCNNPSVRSDGYYSVAGLNDAGYSFSHIAKVIKEQL